MNAKTLHQDSDGISPYLQCPWCGYTDVTSEFMEYRHPDETAKGTGSTQCGQCWAAGPTPVFMLAYDPSVDLGGSNEFRELYLTILQSCGD